MDEAVKRKIKSNDGRVFEVDEQSLELSKVLKDLAKDFPQPEAELPTNEVDGKTLEKIVEYLVHYKKDKPKEIPKPIPNPDLKPILDKWDYDFITPLSLEVVVDLVNAANFLNIPDLVNLCCVRMASEMTNCTIEEARAKFGIVSDMTEEEKAEMDKYPLD